MHTYILSAVSSIFFCIILITGCKGRERKHDIPADDSLVIYSPHNPEMGNFIVKEFRQRTGIKVTLVSGGTGDLLQRIETSGQSSPADVFWGGGAESLESRKFLFQPFFSRQDDHILKEFISGENLWYGLSLMPMVIVYNTTLVSKDKIPAGWNDLLDPYFTNQLRMGNPETSGSSFSMLCTLLSIFTSGDSSSGWNKIQELSRMLGPYGISPSSEDVYKSVAAGEAFAGLTFEDAVLSLKALHIPVEIVYPEEGTAVVPDGIALLKTAIHTENAKTFMEFALGRDAQTMVSERWHRRSVRNDVQAPAGTVELKQIRCISYNYSEIARRKNAILQQWRSLRKFTDTSRRKATD